MQHGKKLNHPDRMLLPTEVKATMLALATMIETMEDADKAAASQRKVFNADARKSISEMLSNARSAMAKLEKHTGGKIAMDDIEPGDVESMTEPPPNDSGTPKLKRLAEEIKNIFEEEDVAGFLIMYTPVPTDDDTGTHTSGVSEYLNHVVTSFSSMMLMENGEVALKAKFKKDDKESLKKMSQTINMITQFAEVGGMHMMAYIDMLNGLKKHFAMEVTNPQHTPGK